MQYGACIEKERRSLSAWLSWLGDRRCHDHNGKTNFNRKCANCDMYLFLHFFAVYFAAYLMTAPSLLILNRSVEVGLVVNFCSSVILYKTGDFLPIVWQWHFDLYTLKDSRPKAETTSHHFQGVKFYNRQPLWHPLSLLGLLLCLPPLSFCLSVPEGLVLPLHSFLIKPQRFLSLQLLRILLELVHSLRHLIPRIAKHGERALHSLGLLLGSRRVDRARRLVRALPVGEGARGLALVFRVEYILRERREPASLAHGVIVPEGVLEVLQDSGGGEVDLYGGGEAKSDEKGNRSEEDG